ncbi:MAG: glycosyltransferase family 4 protein [Actinomycetota bacterium]|nr:glycosyltransferase family 4 protein [Actinomycetota bacterium]
MHPPGRRLRIAFLSYRGKPHVGGQGVYTRHLTKALADLGHHVEVFSGQPYPIVDERVVRHELPSLDIYNDHYPMRFPWVGELRSTADVVEVLAFSSGTFPEPLAFSLRAWQHLRNRVADFDVVHDNQSLGYGLLGIEAAGIPVLGTIHHPITVDRRLELEHAPTRRQRFAKGRWYSFVDMQSRVATRLRRVITVSESSAADIIADHGVERERLDVVPVGVDQELFRPLDDVAPVPGRIITTASADVTMKGLRYLLEALAKVRVERPDTHLVVIGRRKPGGTSDQTITALGLDDHVEFVSGVSDQRIVELYAEAELAVVPSLYEGFSLPAIEAMASGVPLIATTGGALPEVVGADGDTAICVPPGDAEALAAALGANLGRPELRGSIGARGRRRVLDRWTWRHTADRTLPHYEAVMAEAAAGVPLRPPRAGGRRAELEERLVWRRVGR